MTQNSLIQFSYKGYNSGTAKRKRCRELGLEGSKMRRFCALSLWSQGLIPIRHINVSTKQEALQALGVQSVF